WTPSLLSLQIRQLRSIWGANPPAIEADYYADSGVAYFERAPCSSGLSHRPPDAFSRKIFSHPADRNAETCAAVSCSFVETRAYPNIIIAQMYRHSRHHFQRLTLKCST